MTHRIAVRRDEFTGLFKIHECVGRHNGMDLMIEWDGLYTTEESAWDDVRKEGFIVDETATLKPARESE
jgi:hypothetical protein